MATGSVPWMLATTATDAAVLITAVCAGVAVLVGSVVTLLGALGSWAEQRAAAEFRSALADQLATVHDGVQEVKTELRTMNGQTVGQMADAGESRRIEAIAEADRTAAEDRHVVAVPPVPPAEHTEG